MGSFSKNMLKLFSFIFLIFGALAAPNAKSKNDKTPLKKMTPEAAASCDPDYGWINGPDGTNKCYYILRDQQITDCGLGYGGGGGGVCSPDYYNCYAECYDTTCCYDYSCSGGGYYGTVTWYEAMQCCVQNYGFLAEPASADEHELIKGRLQTLDGNYTNSYWLGGVDFFAEGTWQWVSGQQWGYETWHEGEPNNVDNEDCLSMSGNDGYNWMDLQCHTRDHAGTVHYAVCENRKG